MRGGGITIPDEFGDVIGFTMSYPIFPMSITYGTTSNFHRYFYLKQDSRIYFGGSGSAKYLLEKGKAYDVYVNKSNIKVTEYGNSDVIANWNGGSGGTVTISRYTGQ